LISSAWSAALISAATLTSVAMAWAVFELTRPMAKARVVAVRMASWPAPRAATAVWMICLVSGI
jgi:hypothetical protein